MEIVFFLSKSRLKVPRPHKKRLKLILKKKKPSQQASLSYKAGSKIASSFDWKRKKMANAF